MEVEVTVLAFGIAREIMQDAPKTWVLSESSYVGTFRKALEAAFPALCLLKSYMIAVNQQYAADDLVLEARDEIAIIPPVSGG
ncbi:molybdopterin synthase sulfur carrier subunit [Arachidicoccus rhizosphaerae]|uniref:Molybdopterin synthase sulfur carrier subunit n=1 Tax=Arachidicoccus rhizosphaerae TaxID=551991 RepID=A0A1H3ZGH3_9BACT|nr:MoaD/ThiS family protein [Arachidicoccus rhizosphaerae]SEA22628.1 molybdopterin synthase sulfur carrier subunit [Arachidicoccus rhizosphaerae]